MRSVRSAKLPRYPYRISYRIEGGTVHIVYIGHTARKPINGLHEPPEAAFAQG